MKHYTIRIVLAGTLLIAGVQYAAAQDAALKEAQRQLTAKGYRLGAPDGFMGRRTQQALRNFQRDRGLEQTGTLNDATVSALKEDTTPAREPTSKPLPEVVPEIVVVPLPPPLPIVENAPAVPAALPLQAQRIVDDTASAPPSPSAPVFAAKRSWLSGWGWWLAGGMMGSVVLQLWRRSQTPIVPVPSKIVGTRRDENPPARPAPQESATVAAGFNPLRPAVSPAEQRQTQRTSSQIASYIASSNAAAVAKVLSSDDPDFRISPIIDVSRNVAAGSGSTMAARPSATVPKSGATAWIRPDEEVRVKDIVIRGGFFYLGEKLGTDPWREENCLVRPSLPVAGAGKASAVEFGYHRHYSHAPPPARRAYLEWLASGRDDPATPVGLVALYFFGLEYRMFNDAAGADAPALTLEVERLRRIYGGESWLDRHFDAFLVGARLRLEGVVAPVLTLERTSYSYEIPFDIRVHLGAKIEAKKPLNADDALLWVANVPDISLRTPVLRCGDEFRALWTLRFGERHPDGLRVRAPKKRLKLSYRAASGTFETAVCGPHEALPDIGAVSGPVARLRELFEACTTELEPFSRLLGRRPQARTSALALLSLPEPLRNLALLTKLADGLGRLVGDAQLGIVPYADLLALIDPDLNVPDKPGAALQDQVARVLDELDLAIEPDRRYGGRLIDASTHVVLFRAIGGAAVDPDGLAYQGMRALVETAVLAAASDGDVTDDEIAAVGGMIARQGLTQAQTLRLTAFAASLRLDRPKQQSVLRKLQDRPRAERELIAKAALATVMSDGVATAAEVRFLEQLHRALGLSSDDVYGAIHRFAPDCAAPAMSASVGAGDRVGNVIAVDPERLKKLREETQQVSRLLSDIFVEDSVVAPEKAILVEVSAYPGLDQAHAALLDAIAGTDGELPRSAYDDLARRLGLLPDGAIETLNDWAFDRFDEPLIEAEVEIMIVPHLRATLREAKVSL